MFMMLSWGLILLSCFVERTLYFYRCFTCRSNFVTYRDW